MVIGCFALLVPAGLCADDWSELQGDGFLLHFLEADRGIATVLWDDLESGRREVARKLGGVHEVPISVYLATGEREFRDLTHGRIPHWGVACAFPSEQIVVLRKLPGELDLLLRVARHEISHVLLHQAVTKQVPVWFDEGVAMWAAQEWRVSESAEVFVAVLFGGLVPLEEIDSVLAFPSSRAQLAYTQSFLAVVYLIHAGGQDAVASVVSELASGASFDVALFRTTGLTPQAFEQQWADYVRARFSLAGLLISPEAIWFYLAGLFLVVTVAVRIRNRRVLKSWEDEDPESGLPLHLRLQVHKREEKS